MCKIQKQTRHNFSLVARYSLKFTRCSLLVVKSLVAHCKICQLLVAEVACCQKSLVTRCKKSLVTRCEIRSLLVAEVACCRRITSYSLGNLLVTRCKIALCKKSLLTRCKIRSFLVAEVSHCKIHSLLIALLISIATYYVKSLTRTNFS